jgi:hypothetical protein
MSENFQVPNRAVAVTPSDTTEVFASAIYVGSGGNLSVVTEGGDTVTFSNVPAGTTLVIRVTRIRATSTTATNIVRMW